jgi:adenylate cyclase
VSSTRGTQPLSRPPAGGAVERASGLGAPRYTRRELAARSGVPAEVAQRFWRAMGFPDVGEDERLFTDTDLAMLTALRLLLEAGLAEADLALQLTRVTGQSLARVADAQVGALAARLAAREPEPASPEELLEAQAALLPVLEQFLTYVWRRHLAAAVGRALFGRSSGGAETPLAVGFADLVGFTARSQELDDAELAAMVDRFEALVTECVASEGGRVVKMIGDEAMFVADAPVPALRIAVSLADACHADEVIPDARVGLAWGHAVAHQGDFYGPTVNLASRLVNLARPGAVLVSDEFREALPPAERRRFRPALPHRLKGIGFVPLWLAYRAGRGA